MRLSSILILFTRSVEIYIINEYLPSLIKSVFVIGSFSNHICSLKFLHKNIVCCLSSILLQRHFMIKEMTHFLQWAAISITLKMSKHSRWNSPCWSSFFLCFFHCRFRFLIIDHFMESCHYVASSYMFKCFSWLQN